MATDAGYAKYVCDQLQAAGGITTVKMFGEYGLYRHGKIVALICDNQLFVKPTPEGAAIVGNPTWGPPYPGAKPFINASDLLDDPEALVRLVLATDAALPAPKAKHTVPKGKKQAPKEPVKSKAAVNRKPTRQASRETVRKSAPKKKATRASAARRPRR